MENTHTGQTGHKIMNRFRSWTCCFFIKLFSKKVSNSLVPLYFAGQCKNKRRNTVAVIDKISSLLQEGQFDEECKRVRNTVSCIIFTDMKPIGCSWGKSREIAIQFGQNYSENFLYMLGAIIWCSYCIEIWRKNKKKPSEEINKIGFNNMQCFLQKVGFDTSSIEKYFKEAYPMYV